MKMYSEKSLFSFEFWSGAVDTANMLTSADFDIIESVLEEDRNEAA